MTEHNYQRLTSSLTEYQELRAEIRLLEDHQLKLYSLLITTILAVTGATLTTEKYDIVLVFPIIALGFTFRYIWNTKLLILLGDYIGKMDKEIFEPILDKDNINMSSIGWQSYFFKHYKILPFHKFANLIIFIIIPFSFSLIYCILVILKSYITYITLSMEIYTLLPNSVYIIWLIVFLPIGIYLGKSLWTADKTFN